MKKSNLPTQLAGQGINPPGVIEKYIHRYWQPRKESEQKAMLCAAFLMGCALYFCGVWQPVNSKIAQQQATQQQLAELQSKLDSWAQKVPAKKSAQAETDNMADYLSQSVSESTTKFGVVIENLQVEEEVINVELEPVAFNSLVEWLNYLRAEHGFQVNQLSVMATKPGVIAVQQLELFYPR